MVRESCSHYFHEEETCLHSLYHCSVAIDLWCLVSAWLEVEISGVDNSMEVFEPSPSIKSSR